MDGGDLNKMVSNSDQYQGEQQIYRGIPEESKGIMLNLMDTESLIATIDLQLQGMGIDPLKTNEDGGAMWSQMTTPYVHKDLRVQLINQVRSHINKVTLYSNINQSMIETVCIDLHIAICDLLFYNEDMIRARNTVITKDKEGGEIWTLKATDNSDVWTRAELILYMIMNPIWLGLYQAFEHGQRGVIEKIGGFSESRVMPNEPNKKRKKLLGVI